MGKSRKVSLGIYMIGIGLGIGLLSAYLKANVFKTDVGMVIIAGLGGILAYVSMIPFRKSTFKLKKGMEEIARGDLTVRVGVEQSIKELDVLLKHFDYNLVGNLQVILLGMKDILEDNRTIVREVSKTTEASKQNTEQMMERVDKLQQRYMELTKRIGDLTGIIAGIHQGILQVDEQIEQQSGAIHQTSTSVEQMSSSLETVARVATTKQEITQSLIRTAQEGGQKVKTAMDAMSQMTLGIEEIQKVVELINDVAARTNLLAMNAAIEATHAGQYGKGFAVVAAEIRKLAESTASHTKKVGMALSEFMEKMGYLEDAAQIAFNTIHRINEEIQKFVGAFGEIVKGTQEAASGGSEMLRGVTALRGSADTLRTASQRIRDRISEIHRSIGSIQEASQESYAELEILGSELKTVGSLEDGIYRIGMESLDRINALSTELKYFKLEKNSLGEDDEYTHELKEIILNHKRIVFSSKAFLQGRIEKRHLPNPLLACPLDAWIRKLRMNPAFKQDLSVFGTKHAEFHRAYAEFTKKSESKEEGQELVRQIETQWKELIMFRDIINRAMQVLKKEGGSKNYGR